MAAAELFWLVVAIVVAVSAVYVVREVRRYPKGSLRPRGSAPSWVLAALIAVRLAQGFLVFIVLAGAVVPAVSGLYSVNVNLGSARAVTVSDDGSMVIRGEAGYMVDLCSGDRGARGGVAAAEICGDEDKVEEAIGVGTRVDRVMVMRTVHDPPARVATLFWLSLLIVVAFIVALQMLGQMLVRARRGQPFSREGVRSLRVLAVAFAVAGVVPVITDAIVDGLVAQYLGEGARVFGAGSGWLWSLFVALILLALAEIWRYGTDLQEEADGVV